MAIDLDALRRAYFASEERKGPPDHIPTREELYALYEQRAVAACLAVGRDPVTEGLGEHGSLIGGPDKPLRVLPAEPEDCVPIEPMPLAWFSYPQAFVPKCDDSLPDPEEQGHPVLKMLCGAYFAGVPQRPIPARLARMLRAEELDDAEAFVLGQLFAAIFPAELALLLSRERLTVHELARAIHLSGTRRAQVVRWLHQFAVRPEHAEKTQSSKAEPCSCPGRHTSSLDHG